MKNKIRTLRAVGFAEGVSFLVLLFIAMPMKYLLGIPEAVKFVGWAHGVLFMAYIGAVVLARTAMKWGLMGMLVAFAASLLPFGTFVLDRQLKRRAIALQSKSVPVQ